MCVCAGLMKMFRNKPTPKKSEKDNNYSVPGNEFIYLQMGKKYLIIIGGNGLGKVIIQYDSFVDLF